MFCVVLGLQMLVQPTNSASGATNAMPGLLRYPILGPYPFMLPMPMVAAPTGPVVQPVARESAPDSNIQQETIDSQRQTIVALRKDNGNLRRQVAGLEKGSKQRKKDMDAKKPFS